jgi:hypothetical protein
MPQKSQLTGQRSLPSMRSPNCSATMKHLWPVAARLHFDHRTVGQVAEPDAAQCDGPA